MQFITAQAIAVEVRNFVIAFTLLILVVYTCFSLQFIDGVGVFKYSGFATDNRSVLENRFQTGIGIRGRSLAASSRDISNDPSRIPNSIKARIVGGQPAQIGRYPFYGHSTGSSLCGGTLIHEDVLLTAAHCEKTFAEDVIIGSNDVFGRDGAERIPIESLLVHPNYGADRNAEENDIMLVKLARPSSGPLVTLNTEQNLPGANETVKVIGFGLTSDGGQISAELLEVEVEAIEWDLCSNFIRSKVFPETQLCAGALEGGRDSCAGDSGGPLLSIDLVQYGIVSYGFGCARPRTPAIYTRVSSYRQWIQRGICDLSSNPPDSCSLLEGSVPSTAPSEAPSLSPSHPRGDTEISPSSSPSIQHTVTPPPSQAATETATEVQSTGGDDDSPTLAPSVQTSSSAAPSQEAITQTPSAPAGGGADSTLTIAPSVQPTSSAAPSQESKTETPSTPADITPSLVPSSHGTSSAAPSQEPSTQTPSGLTGETEITPTAAPSVRGTSSTAPSQEPTTQAPSVPAGPTELTPSIPPSFQNTVTSSAASSDEPTRGDVELAPTLPPSIQSTSNAEPSQGITTGAPTVSTGDTDSTRTSAPSVQTTLPAEPTMTAMTVVPTSPTEGTESTPTLAPSIETTPLPSSAPRPETTSRPTSSPGVSETFSPTELIIPTSSPTSDDIPMPPFQSVNSPTATPTEDSTDGGSTFLPTEDGTDSPGSISQPTGAPTTWPTPLDALTTEIPTLAIDELATARPTVVRATVAPSIDLNQGQPVGTRAPTPVTNGGDTSRPQRPTRPQQPPRQFFRGERPEDDAVGGSFQPIWGRSRKRARDSQMMSTERIWSRYGSRM